MNGSFFNLPGCEECHDYRATNDGPDADGSMLFRIELAWAKLLKETNNVHFGVGVVAASLRRLRLSHVRR
jgi:hypothetical protein